MSVGGTRWLRYGLIHGIAQACMISPAYVSLQLGPDTEMCMQSDVFVQQFASICVEAASELLHNL